MLTNNRALILRDSSAPTVDEWREQKAPDDLEYLGQIIATSNLDFTPLQRIVDRPQQHSSRQTGRQIGRSRSVTNTISAQRTRTDSATDSESVTHSRQHARGIGRSHAEGDSQSAGVSEARGESENVSYQVQQITRYREEFQPTGKLLMAVPDQIAMMQRMLATLPMGHVLTRFNDPKPK